MTNEWLDESLAKQSTGETALTGVSPALVVDNIDITGQGRVQIKLPWIPDIQPWARVAAPGAGSGRGFYMIPQTGDEVLVAFAHGDIREPYVIGSLWNRSDPPPYMTPQAPIFNRKLKTPKGHELEFDDLTQTVTLKTTSGQTVEMSPTGVAITQESGISITLGVGGDVSINAATSMSLNAVTSMSLNAAEISLKGTRVSIQADAALEISTSGVCEIQGSLVKIN